MVDGCETCLMLVGPRVLRFGASPTCLGQSGKLADELCDVLAVRTAMPAESIFGTGCPPLVWILRIRPCGDCLTYSPGHYKTWDHWRRDRTVEPALRAIVQSSETKNVWVLGANGRVAYYCTAAYTRLSRLRGRRAGAGKFQGAAARQGVPVPLNRVRAVGDARLIAGRGCRSGSNCPRPPPPTT